MLTSDQWFAAIAALVIPIVNVLLQRAAVWLTGHLGSPTAGKGESVWVFPPAPKSP